jgi:hypothetical protein
MGAAEQQAPVGVSPGNAAETHRLKSVLLELSVPVDLRDTQKGELLRFL